MTAVEGNYRIVTPSLTVKAMRDSGYKSTAYALAELIDNSIDASAAFIEVFACEEPHLGPGRTSYRVEKIAVLDDGTGMKPELLRRALKYGDGLGDDRMRIGRFGMGLPNSSMSQCTRVEVWSWTSGPGNAMWTYLDLEEVNNGLEDVPDPVHSPVPDYWRNLSEAPLGGSGTLVVWTSLDRVNWHGASATLRNTAELIGRIYRHYLKDEATVIKMAPVREGSVLDSAYYAKPNDPLYLMTPTGTPPPFGDKPMFEPFDMGNPDEPGVTYFPVIANGQKYNVRLRASIARLEARRHDVEGHPWPDDASPGRDAGSHPWGKHAMRNTGISLVRNGRELDLDASWTIGYDPVERWWGIEVDFPAELDDVFGVTNNKQTAVIFSSLAHFDWRAEQEEDESLKALKDRLSEQGDPRVPLIELAVYVQGRLLPAIRRKLRQRARPRPQTKQQDDSVAAKASDAVRRRQDEGYTGRTDERADETTEQDKRNEQMDALTNRHHFDEETARAMVDEAMAQDWRVRWIESSQDTEAFFTIDLMQGMLEVVFNSEHPVHSRLMAALEEVPETASEDELRQHLARAAEAFKLLIFSWARMEDELPGKRDQDRIAQARRDWGRYARDFISGGEDE